MIRKLRIRFVTVTMSILTVMLFIIFSFVYHNTKVGLETQSIGMMQTSAINFNEPFRPGKRDDKNPGMVFILREDVQGNWIAMGPSQFDLSDIRYLSEIGEKALNNGKVSGILKEYNLRFYQTEKFGEKEFIFTDVSNELNILNQLVRTCCLIGIGALAAFFGISYLLARWVTKPVALSWEQQKQFVADASHELKTPLTIIQTNAELLDGELEGDPEKKSYAGGILDASHRMRKLVESMLDLARSEQDSRMSFSERMNGSDLVNESVMIFEPVFFESGIMLCSDIQDGIILRGNRQELKKVIDNLLDNARKYTTGTETRVEFHLMNSHQCLLSVREAGEPMSEETCKNIFKRFYQTDPSRTKSGSYGLGLSIAENIVKQCHGKIWAESKDGYNTFFVSLPVEHERTKKPRNSEQQNGEILS